MGSHTVIQSVRKKITKVFKVQNTVEQGVVYLKHFVGVYCRVGIAQCLRHYVMPQMSPKYTKKKLQFRNAHTGKLCTI